MWEDGGVYSRWESVLGKCKDLHLAAPSCHLSHISPFWVSITSNPPLSVYLPQTDGLLMLETQSQCRLIFSGHFHCSLSLFHQPLKREICSQLTAPITLDPLKLGLSLGRLYEAAFLRVMGDFCMSNSATSFSVLVGQRFQTHFFPLAFSPSGNIYSDGNLYDMQALRIMARV